MNLITNLINRWLIVYERWKNVKQNSNQKISIFKTYLKNLKNYLFDFFENQKTFYFLIKLRSKFKQKIFDTNNVLKTRENILNIVIMQKKNLKRTRENNDNNNLNSNNNSNRNQLKF